MSEERKVKPLSERIERRIERCKQCKGTGSYMWRGMEMACMYCADWITTLREVRVLESKT